jgi:hypothetical protein
MATEVSMRLRALALILVASVVAGCSPPIRHSDISDLRDAINYERARVTPNDGEAANVAAVRAGIDAQLAAMAEATRPR